MPVNVLAGCDDVLHLQAAACLLRRRVFAHAEEEDEGEDEHEGNDGVGTQGGDVAQS